MKTINIIAVVRFGEPMFVPLKLTFPDFDYNCSDYLEKIIRDIDWGKVNYKTDIPIIHKFEDEHSRMLRDSMDWSKAADLKWPGNSVSCNYLLRDHIGGVLFDDLDAYLVTARAEYVLDAWSSTFGKRRVREFEPKFAECEGAAASYIKRCVNLDWISWTEEELVISPVFMWNYALKVCKGRLPDHLDNAMLLASYKTPDSEYVKRYFKTKRYRIRSGKSLLNEAEA